MTPRTAILLVALLAVLPLAGCGGDDEPETTTTTSSTTTTGVTGATGATGEEGAASAPETEGLPIEELVALAAEVEPTEVDCGDEALESVIGGGGTCQATGDEYVVADPGKKLELDSLTARLVDMESAKTARGDYLKPKPSKEGEFLIAKLAVTSTSDRKVLFDNFGEQVRLHVDTDTYTEPFPILNGVVTDSFLWKGNRIKPGDTQIGRVVFDLPEPAHDQLAEEGSIEVLNFADQGNFKRADQIGLLRTG